MDLKDIKVLPGIVIDVADPKYIGRVKADCPGLFDSSVMNKEGLPWIYPFSMNGYQRFSKLRVSSKIWIFTDKDYNEFWYVPMFQLNDDTKEIVSSDTSDYDESEVLLSRTAGDNGVYIYYSPSKGIVLQNSENTLINLTPDNQIILKSGDGQVTVKNNHVYLGNTDTDSMEAAVFGEKLVKMLDDLKGKFLQLSSAALAGPYTVGLSKPFTECANTLSDTQSLLTSNSFVN